MSPALPPTRRKPQRDCSDHEAILELYEAERDGMVRLAHLLTGSIAVAEDVVQDAFVRLHGAMERVERPGAYLRTAVVNLCNSYHRRRQVEARWMERQPGPGITLPPDLDETWQALATLPSAQREALVLRFYLDLKVDEVAELLDRPVGTIKSHIHRGLAALSPEVSR